VSFLKIGTPVRNRGFPRKRKSVAMSRFWQKRPVGGFSEKRATCAELQFSSKTEKCAGWTALEKVGGWLGVAVFPENEKSRRPGCFAKS
jgi:hypothetical protein